MYAAGGGNTRTLVTLAGFIAGSTIGAAQAHWWTSMPALRAVSLITALGVVPALVISLALLGLIAAATVWLERRRHGDLVSVTEPPVPRLPRARRGPWPLVWGAIGLAFVNFATLVLAGRPWGVTSALALWGSKVAMALGVDAAAWPYWSAPARAAELRASVFRDMTSVEDFGIILGALAAAGLAGRFGPRWRVPLKSLVAAIAGGLLLGYGARIAYGCNIGAFFSGVASASLHGWLWLVAAFTGTTLGTRLRPLFGLSVERTSCPSRT